MASNKWNMVEVTSESSLIQVALEMCKTGQRTLIVVERDGFVPSIHRINALRNSVSFCECRCYFSVVTKNFDSFDCFILAGNMNHFEQEFFRQLRKSTDKEIIEIRKQARNVQ